MTTLESEVARRRDALELATGNWVPTTLAGALDRAAGRFGPRPYVLSDDRAIGYAEVRDRSIAIAGGLMSLGVGPGDRVALLVDNVPDYPAIKFGIARAGAIAVPLNYSYKQDEILQRLRQSGAAVVIAVDASAATDFLAVFDGIAPGWERGAPVDGLPELRRILLVDNAKRPAALDLAGLGNGGVGAAAVAERTAGISPDDVADIVFTPGTTGHPLGAQLTHDMVLRSSYGSAYHRAFDDGWRIAFALPLYHVFGYIEGLLAALWVGGAVEPLRVFNPKTVLAVIERDRINEVLFVPTMTVAVVEQAVREPRDLSSLQSIFSAAAPAPVWLWERTLEVLRPTMIFTGYGQTEVSAATALTRPGDDIATVASVVGALKLGGVAAEGVGFDGRLADYRTIDPFTGAPLPLGEVGELQVRGPQVTGGYFQADERAAALIDADGWLRTGDLGSIDEQGYIRLQGRSGELFKVGGELVTPVEVEQVLTAIEGVSQAFVAGVPEERYGFVPWAWVVPGDGVELDEHELIVEVRRHVANFKVPRGVTLLSPAELPTTTTGKVQKFLLVRSWLAAAGPGE